MPNGSIQFQRSEEAFHRHLTHVGGRPWSILTNASPGAARTTFPDFKSARAVASVTAEPEPYLLVLLADQEIEADREEKAMSLIEAAYAAYDQCTFGS